LPQLQIKVSTGSIKLLIVAVATTGKGLHPTGGTKVKEIEGILICIKAVLLMVALQPSTMLVSVTVSLTVKLPVDKSHRKVACR